MPGAAAMTGAPKNPEISTPLPTELTSPNFATIRPLAGQRHFGAGRTTLGCVLGAPFFLLVVADLGDLLATTTEVSCGFP